MAFAALLTPFFAAARDRASPNPVGSPAEPAAPAGVKKRGRKKHAAKKTAPFKKKKARGERLREPGQALGGR